MKETGTRQDKTAPGLLPVLGVWSLAEGLKGQGREGHTSARNSVPATHVNGIVLHVRLQNSRAKLLLAGVNKCQKPGCWGSVMTQRPFNVHKHPRESRYA